jgi:hypothetical protein
MTDLCFIDTETTGLDARIHQPYEVSWWLEDEPEPSTEWLLHDLTHADPRALDIGRYWERGAHRARPTSYLRTIDPQALGGCLVDVTLVGSNPAFDAAMLTRYIGAPVWHHRLINVAEGAMWLFGWDRPKGLASVTTELRKRRHDIPEPDHTAEGDVRTTRAVYYALRQEAGQ